MNQEVKIDDDSGVRWIEIDRPESRNGLTPEVCAALMAALGEVATTPALRVVVLSGAGGSFSSGLDLADATRRRLLDRPEDITGTLGEYFQGMIRAVRDVPVPTIAAVDGAAAGIGCDLALACDLRLVSERARFTEVFARRGLIPDGGATYLLPRLVGLGRALELMYTGDIVDASTAHSIGLANHVFDTHEFRDRVWTMAKKLARGAPIALRLIKQAVYAGQTGTFAEALAREKAGQGACFATRDFAEGVAAFLGKRDPEFKGE